jgi:hypothetical protein
LNFAQNTLKQGYFYERQDLMARPTKQGIDYFPLDTQFDDKIELLIAEMGAISLSILVTIWQLIYQNEGYYIADNDDLLLLVKRRINTDINTTREVIIACIKRDIFSPEMNKEHGILTSKAIQKRYFLAANRKKNINVNNNYLCEGVNAGNNHTSKGVSVVKNATKEKEKEKENTKGKGKGITETVSTLQLLSEPDKIKTLMITTFGRNPTFPERDLIKTEFLSKWGIDTVYQLFKEASLKGFKKLITLRDNIEIINNKPQIKERENERNNQRPNGRTQDNPGRDDPGERELLERLKSRPYASTNPKPSEKI